MCQREVGRIDYAGNPKARGLAYLDVAEELILAALREGIAPCRIAENPLPADARIVSVELGGSMFGRFVRLILESKEFAPVVPGEAVPPVPDLVFVRGTAENGGAK